MIYEGQSDPVLAAKWWHASNKFLQQENEVGRKIEKKKVRDAKTNEYDRSIYSAL